MSKPRENQTTDISAYVNQDVVETLRGRDKFEDSIFQQLDKIQALSEAQRLIDVNETPLTSKSRGNYSTMMDEQLQELRHLLERCFS